MIRIITLGLLMSAVVAFASDPSANAMGEDYPPHTISHSQLRTLPASSPDRTYQLHIGLPPSYSRQPGRRFPVVYVTDGYWDFQKLTAIRAVLINDKVVPEFIVVGLGYAGQGLDYHRLRLHDLFPVQVRDSAETGHAAKFLQVIEEQVIPLVEREYRADPSYRVLAGASAGGLFTLYAMYTKPALFNGWVAATPAIFFAKNDWLLNYEREFAQAGGQLKGRLYMTVGGNEGADYVASILRYNERVVSRRYPELAYDFRIIEGERHSGGQMEAYVRGLRFVFQPLAPESGPSPRNP
jgi:Predicted hydrolase of the alpha/beta superfamily